MNTKKKYFFCNKVGILIIYVMLITEYFKLFLKTEGCEINVSARSFRCDSQLTELVMFYRENDDKYL